MSLSMDLKTSSATRITTIFCAPKDLALLAPITIMSNTESLVFLLLYADDDDFAFAELKKYFHILSHFRKLSFEFAFESDHIPDQALAIYSHFHWAQLTHLVLDIPDYDCWAVIVTNFKSLICGVFDFGYENLSLVLQIIKDAKFSI